MPTIHMSVRAALRDSGCRKAGTAFEIASTPVIAVHPAENACSSRNRPIASVGPGTSTGAIGAAPVEMTLVTPMPISASMLTTKI